MATYFTPAESGQCMRSVTEHNPATGYLCPKRATRRCLEFELCDEHAAEWLAHKRAGHGSSTFDLSKATCHHRRNTETSPPG